MKTMFRLFCITIIVIIGFSACEPGDNNAGFNLGVPTGVAAQAQSSSSIQISWTEVTDAAGYTVYRSSSQTGNFTEVGTPTSTSFTNTSLTPDTTYWYKVSARSADGVSGQSEAVSATTHRPEGWEFDISDFTAPSSATAQWHSTFQGKSNVLRVNGANWSLLEFSLAPYAGREITIHLYYDVWVEPAAGVLWQINSSGFPTVAGGQSNLTTGAWHTVSGSRTITPASGNVVYLSQQQLGGASAYFANFKMIIEDDEYEYDPGPPPSKDGIILLFDVPVFTHNNTNAYLTVYGWTRNPLIEFYIIESYGVYTPPGIPTNGSDDRFKGTFEMDGGTYNIFRNERYGPTIDGNQNFIQFYSVRIRNQMRTEGQISISEHFKEWEKRGMGLGASMYEVTLCIEAYAHHSAGSSNVEERGFGNAVVAKNILYLDGIENDPVSTTNAAADSGPITANITGQKFNGYNFEFWTDAQQHATGGSMTLTATDYGGTFNVEWDSDNAIRQDPDQQGHGNGRSHYNILFRMGHRF